MRRTLVRGQQRCTISNKVKYKFKSCDTAARVWAFKWIRWRSFCVRLHARTSIFREQRAAAGRTFPLERDESRRRRRRRLYLHMRTRVRGFETIVGGNDTLRTHTHTLGHRTCGVRPESAMHLGSDGRVRVPSKLTEPRPKR